jgi:hypothetical protein
LIIGFHEKAALQLNCSAAFFMPLAGVINAGYRCQE